MVNGIRVRVYGWCTRPCPQTRGAGPRELSPSKFSAGTSVKGKAAQTVRRPGAIKLVTSCQALIAGH